jgi:hypothetical protein
VEAGAAAAQTASAARRAKRILFQHSRARLERRVLLAG